MGIEFGLMMNVRSEARSKAGSTAGIKEMVQEGNGWR